MAKCPNINDDSWKRLVAELGLRDAYKAFLMNDDVPTVEQARELLSATSGIYYQKQLNNIKHELQNKLKRAAESDDNIGKTYRVLEAASGEEESRGSRVLEESGKNWAKIQRGDLSYPEGDLWGKLDIIAEETEHIVFDNGNSVIKVNKVSSDDIPKYLNKLIVHNYLFSETSYSLLGFINQQGKISPVVKQERIEENGPFDIQKIGRHLFNKYGMSNPNSQVADIFSNSDLGIAVADITPSNVYMRNGKPYFIDPIIIIDYKRLYSNENINYIKDGLQSGINKAVSGRGSKGIIEHAVALFGDDEGTGRQIGKRGRNNELDRKVQEFLKSIGVEVQRLADEDQDFAAMADTVNGIVSVVDGKADMTTLAHEATHLFLDLLPEGSKLLADIVADVKGREEYDTVYNRYKNSAEYQKPHQYTFNIAEGFDNEGYFRTMMNFRDKVNNEWVGTLSIDDPKSAVIAGTIGDYGSEIDEKQRGKGLGKQMYIDAAKYIYQKWGTQMKSDKHQVSQSAERVWKSLEREGIAEQIEVPNEFDPEIKYKQYRIKKSWLDAKEIDEDKMAKETAAHIIDDIVVEKFKDRQALRWWERLWKWIQNLFKGKNLNAFETVAEDILDSDTGKLSKEKIKAMKDANLRGEIYYQLSDRDEGYVKGIRSRASDKQKQVIDDVYTNPAIRVSSDAATHTYTDMSGAVYQSVTTLLNGKTHLDPEDFVLNKELGNDFDSIMQSIALGKSVKEIDGLTQLQGEHIQQAYDILTELYNEVVDVNDIVLTQVVVSDPITKVAGSIDLLIVHPDGTTKIVDLKTMRKGRTYTTAMTPGEGAVINERLSRRMKHAIQVATYRRLLGVMGYPNSDISAVYVDMAIEGEKKEQKLLGFTKGTEVVFTESSWDNYAKQIVPTEPVADKTKPEQLFSEEELASDEQPVREPVDVREQTKKIDQLLDEANKIYKHRIAYFEALMQGGSSYIPQQSTINDINSLLYEVATDRSKGQIASAYGKVLVHAQKEIDTWSRYINNPDYVSSLDEGKGANYYNVIEEVRKFIKSYYGITRIRKALNEGQQKMLDDLKESLDALEDSIVDRSWSYVKSIVQKKLPQLTEQEVEDLLTEQKDITKSALLGSDLAGSRDKLAAVLDKMVKYALDQKHRNFIKRREDIASAAERFLKADGGKVDKSSFEFMYEGNKIVGEISPEYFAIKKAVYSQLLDVDGESMQYRIVLDKATAKPEDIAFNKELWYKKQQVREFEDAESEYHEYTPEFIQARARVMTLVTRGNYSKWERKQDVTDEEYSKFNRKNRVHTPYWKQVTEKGEPTGVMVWVSDDAAWFPQKDYITVRKETKSGRDLVNPRYKALMNPTTPLQQAQKDAYLLYMDTMKHYTPLIGPDAEKWLRNGNRVTLMANFIQVADEKGMWNAVKGWLGSEFTPTVFATTQVTDEAGNARQTLPRMYMGGTRNQNRIVTLGNRIQDLAAQKAAGKITKKEYKEERKRLVNELNAEKAKPSDSELEPDVFKQLIAYSEMAENFVQLAAIEGQVKALSAAIEGKVINPQTQVGRQYMEVTALGHIIRQKGTDRPAYKQDANTIRRSKSYIDQVFYGQQNMTKSQVEVLAKKVMNYTSLLGVGVNFFGNVNNYALGRINDAIELAGGKYFERKAYWIALKNFNTQVIPGMARKLGQKSGPYSRKHAESLDEALMEKYRIIREQRSGEEKVSMLERFGAYKLQQAGEFRVQGVPGMAVLYSTDTGVNKAIRVMTSSITGETCSIRDAHELRDGKAVLRQGFTETHEELFNTTNYIFEVNKHIHGSYATEDVTVMQKDILGKLIMQFHKHIMPALRSRFAATYEHPTLGEYEGRWVSALELLRNIYEFDGTWAKKVSGGWHELSDVQKKNILQDGAEILTLCMLYASYVILSGLAEGLDPDEDPNLKRWANFISYESSRLYTETVSYTPTPMGAVQMYQYVKNPIAMTTTLRNFSQAMLSTLQLPLQLGNIGSFTEDEATYQKGPYKGQLKLMHQLKKNVILLNQLDKFDSYSQLSKFSLIGT